MIFMTSFWLLFLPYNFVNVTVYRFFIRIFFLMKKTNISPLRPSLYSSLLAGLCEQNHFQVSSTISRV